MSILEDFSVRPKASQYVAAAKRARATLEQDAPEGQPRSTLTTEQRRILLGIGAAFLVLVLLAMMTYQLNTSRPLQTAPTAAATEAAEPGASIFSQQEEQPVAQEERALTFNVYDAPNGAIIGPVEQDRMITPVAHYGPGWVQVDVQGSGLVWLRAADAPGIAITGPDLQPRPAAPAPDQTGRGMSNPPADAPRSYVENVGAQAPHSPRGDGQAGPSGGEWVAVPTINPVQADNIRLQAPHKVR
jgi:hypothetical protein